MPTAATLTPDPGTPLYLHLPFCVVKCTYCDFYSVAAEGEDLPGGIDALLTEARERAPRAPRTVFLGGGTPSIHEPADLVRLLDGLDAITGFRDSAREVTVECNPESLDLEKARLLRDLGVDRLSIGVQSLDPRILELFGRVHGVPQSRAAFEAARAAGFERVSVDLIYAVPGQELVDWTRDLTEVLGWGPDHVSAYALAFEKGTLLTRWKELGRIAPLSEEISLAFLERTRALFEANGFEAYEVSNFSLNGDRCAHNENYWRNGPYVGLGPSAVSKLAFTRFGNPRSVAAWQRQINREGRATSWEETPAPGTRLAETWWLGLRTSDGVDPRAARETAGFHAHPDADPAELLARDLGTKGLLERTGNCWRLSPSGLPLADAVAQRFLEACRHPAPTEALAPMAGEVGSAPALHRGG